MPPCNCLTEIAALQAQINTLKARLDAINPAPNVLHVEGPVGSGLAGLTLGVNAKGAYFGVLGGPIQFIAIPGNTPLAWLPDANGNLLLGYGGGVATGPYAAFAVANGPPPSGAPNVPQGMAAFWFDRSTTPMRIGLYVNQGGAQGWHWWNATT